MIRVLVVDDHPLVRDSVTAVLDSEPDLVVAAAAGTGEEGLRLAVDGGVDVALVDMRLPGISGIVLCEALRTHCPDVRTVMITSAAIDAVLLAALGAGAKGLMLKESEPIAIRTAVRVVAEGGTYLDPTLAGLVAKLAMDGRRRVKGPHGLTSQELRVVELLPRGWSNRQIGAELGVSEHTVRSHLRGAMRKLGVNRRAEAVAVATREGLA